MNTQETDTDYADLSELVAADGEKDTVGVYEIGYHVVPTVGEDGAEAEHASLTAIVEKSGAEIIGARSPLAVELAYPIEKKIDGANQSFDTAFFGWIAFEAPGAASAALRDTLKANGTILRFLIVATSRDAVAATLADPTLDTPIPKAPVAGEEVPQETAEDATVETAPADTESPDA